MLHCHTRRSLSLFCPSPLLPAAMESPAGPSRLLVLALLSLMLSVGSPEQVALRRRRPPPPPSKGLCEALIRPMGYPCLEHSVKTEDGYILAVQHIPYGKNNQKMISSNPIFLQHGLFQGGDAWFLNPSEQSLGYILADNGFDVWVGNARGTHWSHGHANLTADDPVFWDWSWQDLARYDLMAMIKYIYSLTSSKVLYIGHSQGTITGLAFLTMPGAVEMIEATALLCPISYLNHVTSTFIRRAAFLHLDQMFLTMGIHQLNFRSDLGIEILDSLCAGGLDCSNLLSSLLGNSCCFNGSRVDYYLQYEPHPSSTKNLNHLFQMIRKGTFARYDYGLMGNLKHYGSLKPPSFDIASIPKSLPMWMGYGGTDALADITDVKRTIEELQMEPKVLYIDNYGHLDFILSINAKKDVYDGMIRFFQSLKQHSDI